MSDTILLVAAGLIAVAFVIVQLGIIRVNKKLDVVHVLVNSKMTAALEEIKQLKSDVAYQKGQLDERRSS
jgi:hypothetical protein